MKTLFHSLTGTKWLWAVSAFFLTAPVAMAATFTVTNTANGGAGSLRWAVQQANNLGSADVIEFDPAVFNAAQTITLTSGDLVVIGWLTIHGPGEDLLTIDGNGRHRGFTIVSGTVVISDLTITNAAAGNRLLSPETGLVAASIGGGIYNKTNLTLNQVTISDCAGYPGLSRVVKGGAIFNEGTLELNDCTLSNNNSNAEVDGVISDGVGKSEGGAVYNAANATATIRNSVITGNQARSFFYGDIPGQPQNNAGGGGVYNKGALTLENTVVSNNSCEALTDYVAGTPTRGVGGGIANFGDLTISHGSVISDNVLIADNANVGDAAATGGGIYVEFTSNFTILDSTVSGNTIDHRNTTGGSSAGGGNLQPGGREPGPQLPDHRQWSQDRR